MNILWVTSEPVAEGSVGVTDRVEGPRYFLARGHDVRLVCGGSTDSVPMDGVPTTYLLTRYLPFGAWVDQWPALVRELDARPAWPDVIVADFALLPPAMRWSRGRRRRGLPAPPVVLDVRTVPVEAGRMRTSVQRGRFAVTLRRYGRRAAAVTAITEGVRTEVARHTRLPERDIAVWRSGCAWCDAPPEAMIRPAERRPHLDRFVVLYHGTMTPNRGLFESVEAVARVRETAPDVLLLLLGSGSAVPALRAEVARLGLDEHVQFLPSIAHDAVPEVARRADVGLVPLPPRWEWQMSSPLKLAEDLCLGLPVVLTDITPHRIVPRGAPFAFWAGSGSPAELAGAVLEARSRRAELSVLGDGARAWAEPRLGWSAQLEVLESVLQRVGVRGAAADDVGRPFGSLDHVEPVAPSGPGDRAQPVPRAPARARSSR
jgi:glycosyltransferase involved in cell wall biosynthesis